jgi:hypothetical protein
MVIWDKIIISSKLEDSGKVLRIVWKDGKETIVKGLIKEVRCNKCCQIFEESRLGEYVQYQGLCRPCFASSVFGVSGRIGLEDNVQDYLWKRPASKTISSVNNDDPDDEEPNGADMLRNNFGIGDIVLHHPKTQRSRSSKTEGVVTELHEYWKDNTGELRTYLVHVLFKGSSGPQIFPAREIEALTCSALHLDIHRWKEKLDNVECNFDPSQSKIPYVSRVFRDPIARAIWMSYKINHVFEGNDAEDLAIKSLDASQEIKSHPLPEERVHLWFKKKFNLTPPYSCKMGDVQIAALVPYLIGEKVSEFHINLIDDGAVKAE